MSEGQEKESLGLEDRLKRLEEILAALESDEQELEKSLALFEEGVGHIRSAERILSHATLRVEQVLSSGQTQPLDSEDA